MTVQVSLKGYLYPDGEGGCGSGCGHTASAASPFELAFRRCGAEQYGACRTGDVEVQTNPGIFVPLGCTEAFTSIELLSLRTSAPVKLRIDGAPAQATTYATFPNAALAGTTLGFTVDGVPVSATFAVGEDTALEVARRINSAAALAGASWQPATVELGQVVIAGKATGAIGSLSAFTGDAAPLLGLDLLAPSVGGGADLDVDGVVLLQFRRSEAVRRVEISGSASVSVLAAGT